MPPESMSSSSSETAGGLSTASNSPPQITMWRSLGGKSAASKETSVVNEDPSDVLVKLKKPTAESWLWLLPVTVSLCVIPGRPTGSSGDRGVMSLFIVGLNEGPILFDFVTSGNEREAAEDTRDEVELFSGGECEK